MAASIRARLRKVVFWGLLLGTMALSLGLGLAYGYITDSDNLAALIREQAPRFLPRASLTVKRVLLRPLTGDVKLEHVRLWQTIDGRELSALHIPWLEVKHDFWALLHGRFEPRQVVVAQPKLRLKRRRDGTWNIQGLLADPWPGPPLPNEPVVYIRNATVELVDERDATEAVLRDVNLNIEPTADGPLKFDGRAQGGPFEQLDIAGTFDRATGRIELTRGDLSRLAVSKTLPRLPAEWRELLADRVGRVDGEVDLALTRLTFQPENREGRRRLDYAATVILRKGQWTCPKLPFPLDDVSGSARVAGGVVTFNGITGRNGRTKVRASGTIHAEGPSAGALDLRVGVLDLELDDRLRARTPPNLIKLWDDFKPRGEIDLDLHVAAKPGAEPVVTATVECLDVAMEYRLFPYPLEHVRGTIVCRPERIEIDVVTSLGGEPLTCKGTVDNPEPGIDAVIDLQFTAGAMPIDPALMHAMPPEVVAIVNQYHPTGSGRGTARLRRTPAVAPDEDPEVGHVTVEIEVDLNPGSAMMWDGLKYPVRNLTGHLSIGPDLWVFKDVRGENGQARFKASGWVRQDARKQFEVKIGLEAEHLEFDDNLFKALPSQWQDTWALLNPRGSSRVKADIHVGPGRPDRYHLEIEPEKETRVRLALTPAPAAPGGPRPAPIALPMMEDVKGRFAFDNGTVTMHEVRFLFRESPVEIKAGRVVVYDNSRFTLNLQGLQVKKLRLDSDLQAIMPPAMAGFCRRLDNGRPFRVDADLGIAWSGRSGDPAVCSWENARVIFNDNAVQAGVPLEHLQGEVSHVRGWSDGRTIEGSGVLQLESGSIMQQQVTKLETPIEVKAGKAQLTSIRGQLLGGELTGKVEVSLDATPHYHMDLRLDGADLESYTRTLPGRQPFRGTANAWVDLAGLGNDLRTLRGEGHASITDGDLGRLPPMLRLFKLLRISPMTPTAFDSADVGFKVQSGMVILAPIKFTGNAISLTGQGTVDLQGEVDLRLYPLAGRDARHVPGISDAMREFFGQFFDIRVTGPLAMPRLDAEPLPTAGRIGSRIAENLGRNRRRNAERP